MLCVFRDILDDSAFVQSLITVASKPIIYQPRETRSQSPCLPLSPTSSSPLTPQRVPADISEYVLMNTLQNLMMEAVRGELVLTSHPRAIILPPVSARLIHTLSVVLSVCYICHFLHILCSIRCRRTSNAMAGEEKV